MQRDEHALGLGLGELAFVVRGQGGDLEHRGVEDFSGLQRRLVLEDLHTAVGLDQLDPHVGGGGDRDRALVGEEVAVGERGHPGLRRGRDGAVHVGVLARIGLDRAGRTAIRITLTQNRVHRGTEDFGVARLGVLLGVADRRLGEVRQREALALKLSDGRLKLRDRGADVGQLNDVGVGLEGQRTQLGEGVGAALVGWQKLGKGRQDAPAERDIAGLNVDSGPLGECLHDR